MASGESEGKGDKSSVYLDPGFPLFSFQHCLSPRNAFRLGDEEPCNFFSSLVTVVALVILVLIQQLMTPPF